MTDAAAPADEHDGGLPQLTISIAFAAILLAGIATFLLMRWSSGRDMAANLEAEIATLEEEHGMVERELGDIESGVHVVESRTSVLDNATFVFCNDAAEPVVVRHFGAVRTKENHFETFSESLVPDGLWTIEPGDQRVLRFAGSRNDWDGRYTYYGVVFTGPYHGSTETFSWADNWTGAESEDCSFRFF